ncbi:MAG: 50S ribosomal protein L31e [Candidatus Woesearchaeota archaeon]|jgi:large subunit ribosomal protein L31e
MAEKADKILLERTYNVPLRKGYLKAPNWKRTNKAVNTLREFLAKHMKSENVKISKALNDKLWLHGIKNPPHHVKVTVTKDEKGVVRAELFGAKETAAKKAKNKTEKKKAPVKKEVSAKKAEVVKEEKK